MLKILLKIQFAFERQADIN